MPRGIRKSPAAIEEELSEIETKLRSLEEKVNSLNARKKTLLASREKAEMDMLYRLIKESGMTPAEMISHLSK